MGIIITPSPTGNERRALKSMTLAVNNTTAATVVFTVTGCVLVRRLFGEVTTVLSANVTAAYLWINDQSAQTAISLASGVTLSASPVGSVISRWNLVSGALVHDSAAGRNLTDPNAAQTLLFTPVLLQAKTAVATTVEFIYTTTDAPSSGVILWKADWEPLTENGNLA